MSLPVSFYEKVLKEYDELLNKLSEFNRQKMSVPDACILLKGHNLRHNENVFDYNTDTFCATIGSYSGKLAPNPLLDIYVNEECVKYMDIYTIRREVEKARGAVFPLQNENVMELFCDAIRDDEGDTLFWEESCSSLYKLLQKYQGNKDAYNIINEAVIAFVGNGLDTIAEILEPDLDDLRADLNDVINELESDNLTAEREAELNEQYLDLDEQVQSLNKLIRVIKNEDVDKLGSLDERVENATERVSDETRKKENTTQLQK